MVVYVSCTWLYPVTRRGWKEVMGSNPSHFKCDNPPVEQVSLNDAHEFVRKLNEKEGTNKYRLPSAADGNMRR
ncbi:MAG: SUMF1/EgtB/PvdO family nonheme iron enzyme [Candidatus Methanoperedens sp.]